MKKKNDEFELLKDLPEAARDPEIKAEDFKLVKTDEKIHDQKFQTKPTTFFKDCVRRFRKNKSSVVAAFILGFLLLLSIVIPAVSPYDVSLNADNTDFEYLAPKLFESGTGFWDGNRKYKNLSVDISEMPEAKTEEEKQEHWWPSSKFYRDSISKKVFSDEQYTTTVMEFGKGGFLRHSILKNASKNMEYAELKTHYITDPLDFTTTTVKLTSFDTYDFDKIDLLKDEKRQKFDSDYILAEASFQFVDCEDEDNPEYYEIVAPKVVHSIGSAVSSMEEGSVDIGSVLSTLTSKTTFNRYYFSVSIKNEQDGKNKSTLIRSLTFDVSDDNEELKSKLCDYTKDGVANNGCSFTDATASGRESYWTDQATRVENYAHLIDESSRGIYMSKAYMVSFSYDTYNAKLGTRERMVAYEDLKNWSTPSKNKWETKLLDFNLEYKYNKSTKEYTVNEDTFRCKILDDRCPLAENLTVDDITVMVNKMGIGYQIRGKITVYKFHGYETMPKFLLGTDKNGKDMLTFVFDGLRWSLLLGIVSSAVCFIFGLIWGAICGYFGGNVDLIMERFTDILAGIPWIVVMTLVIIHMGQNFLSFAIALCLTGWIGTAATTRTQFYRFRGREYVLASRTLGASDARLIAKHILPNAMGTIITSAVLMVPSVIFSEATISYLGLGFKTLSSLGVILSNNQSEIQDYPHLLIFPAVIIALLMISFNLFGNGLRDAVNPSLKGEEE